MGEISVLMLRNSLMKSEVADVRGMRRRRRVVSFILSWRKAGLEGRNRRETWQSFWGVIEVR